MLSFKSGKGTSVLALTRNTTCPCSIEVVPFLFSHEQWQQCLQSSTNDNPCSHSTALIVVQSLRIFQEHIIAASFLFLVYWLFFPDSEHHSGPAVSDTGLRKTRADIETLTEQNSHYRCLFVALQVRNQKGDKRVFRFISFSSSWDNAWFHTLAVVVLHVFVHYQDYLAVEKFLPIHK